MRIPVLYCKAAFWYWDGCEVAEHYDMCRKFIQTHYNDVIMGAMASQITSLISVYSTVHSGTDQRKHQSSALLACVRVNSPGPVNSPHKWPVTRKIIPFDDVIMSILTRFRCERVAATRPPPPPSPPPCQGRRRRLPRPTRHNRNTSRMARWALTSRPVRGRPPKRSRRRPQRTLRACVTAARRTWRKMTSRKCRPMTPLSPYSQSRRTTAWRRRPSL